MMIDDLIPDPMSDLFTASMWSKNERVLRSFINGTLTDVGMTPIVEAKVLNPFNIKEFVVSKPIVLDVRVKDERNGLYDIEVQTTRHPAFLNRVLDYWADTYSSQLVRGSDYTLLCPVVSIILTEFSIFPRLKNIHTVFELRARENPDVVMTDHLQFHFLRVSEVQKRRLHQLEGIRRDFCDWLNFFAFAGETSESEMADITYDNPIIQEAYNELKRFYADDESREKIRETRRIVRDYEIYAAFSRDEGRTEGRAEGRAEGKIEGKIEGVTQKIIRVLTRQFQVIPEDVHNRLLAVKDVERLDRLFDIALDCNSLDEFTSSLGK